MADGHDRWAWDQSLDEVLDARYGRAVSTARGAPDDPDVEDAFIEATVIRAARDIGRIADALEQIAVYLAKP